jgi:ribosomal protein S18 acetylase RimI-like enzyme
VNEYNAPARLLYAALGFEVFAVRNGYYKSADGSAADAIVMKLLIQ